MLLNILKRAVTGRKEGGFLWVRAVTREKGRKFPVDERSTKGERKEVFCG